jgi:2-amino-4-hydroxy-6-hydroxymethyldihydropteridine diphosphokinase
MRRVTTAYIGLGSNLDDPRSQVERAMDALAASSTISLMRRSRLYHSAAWGVRDQPDFVNAVVEIETALSARDLLETLLDLERRFGRIRNATRWGPRILDLDLLLYGDQTINVPGLRLPHPHLHERAFVLLPLADIAPQLKIPGRGTVASLLAKIDTNDCKPLAIA